jgi:hypothetical protein
MGDKIRPRRKSDMHAKAKRGILLIAVVALVLGLSGCGTFPFARVSGPAVRAPGPAQREAPLFRNGQVLDIQGRVVLNRNQVTLQDQNSPAVFRFVGLQPAAQKALSGLAGKFTRVRLKVISTESARAYTAQFIQFSTRN